MSSFWGGTHSCSAFVQHLVVVLQSIPKTLKECQRTNRELMNIDMLISTLSTLLLPSKEKSVVKLTFIYIMVVRDCWHNSFTKPEHVLEKPLNHILKFPNESYFEVLNNVFLWTTTLSVKLLFSYWTLLCIYKVNWKLSIIKFLFSM